jgi:predicted PurR-regulated permease PerM
MDPMNVHPLGEAAGERLARRTVLVAAITISLVLAAVIAWAGASALLIIFAGIVLGVIFDTAASALGRILPVRRRIRLAIVVVLLALLLLGGLALSGAVLGRQLSQMVLTVDEQVGNLLDLLNKAGLPVGGDGASLRGLLPDASGLLGGATNAIFGLFGALGNVIFIMFLGAFFAADPAVYHRGVLSLVPLEKRARLEAVLDEAGLALRGWLKGQLLGMLIIFVFSLALLTLIGMPYALLLAVTAGLLTFIPTIGPVFAGIPIILAGLSEGPDMALWGVAVYALIEMAEGNFVTPVVQQRAVELAPAFTLGFQLLMGALFGILGIALAVPLAAAAKVLVEELYVKDALGGPSPIPPDPPPE